MKEKVCTKCKELKSVEDFYKRYYKTGKVGLLSICKSCSYKQHKEYIQNNPEKNPEYNKRAVQKRILKNAWVKDTNVTKVCPKCRIEKTASEFHRNRSMPNGINNYCKLCKNEMDREAYHKKKSDPEWFEKERKRNQERMRKKRLLPIERRLELDRANLSRQLKWLTDPKYRQRCRDNKRKWYNNNLEYRSKARVRNKRWANTLRGKMSQIRRTNRRRYHEQNTLNDLTLEEWQTILHNQNYICLACGLEFDDENIPTMDHIIPVSIGGGLTFYNVQALCKACNASKSDKIIDYR